MLEGGELPVSRRDEPAGKVPAHRQLGASEFYDTSGDELFRFLAEDCGFEIKTHDARPPAT